MDLNDMRPDGSSFGWQSIKDCSLVGRLRDGRDIRISSMERILAFLQNPVSYSGEKLDLKPISIRKKELP